MKVSRECSPIFKFANTSQVGLVMSRERNEHPVESVVVGSWKSFIYIRTAVPNLQKKKKKKKRKKKGGGQWYRYHPSKKGQ